MRCRFSLKQHDISEIEPVSRNRRRGGCFIRCGAIPPDSSGPPGPTGRPRSGRAIARVKPAAAANGQADTSARKANPRRYWFIANQAAGTARRSARRTRPRNEPESRAAMPAVAAPRTFRMPISLRFCSAINADKPKQAEARDEHPEGGEDADNRQHFFLGLIQLVEILVQENGLHGLPRKLGVPFPLDGLQRFARFRPGRGKASGTGKNPASIPGPAGRPPAAARCSGNRGQRR